MLFQLQRLCLNIECQIRWENDHELLTGLQKDFEREIYGLFQSKFTVFVWLDRDKHKNGRYPGRKDLYNIEMYLRETIWR
jgi:hypothetical protein